MASRIGLVTIDCSDPAALASFWCKVLDHEKKWGDDNWVQIGAADGGGLLVFFQRVPEKKVAKNRVHLDLLTEDRDAEVQRLSELGAVRVEDHEVPNLNWTIMADPEGNEFCVAQIGGMAEG
jgi:predicted enzyme related to lactoylglutathione lyase